MENHYRELLRLLSARLGDQRATTDVAHDAYLHALKRSSQAQIEHPEAFLCRAALNLTVDEHRRSQVCQAEPLEALDGKEGLASPSPQTVVNQRQRLNSLQRALAELPAIYRGSFLSRKLNGLSRSQIAERFNISRSLMGKHIVNAMKHCRVRIRGWETD